jgi:hypothetical protein
MQDCEIWGDWVICGVLQLRRAIGGEPDLNNSTKMPSNREWLIFEKDQKIKKTRVPRASSP